MTDRSLPVETVHPTQLYLDAAKLESVIGWFDFDEPAYGRLPVFEFEGEWYLADGHTRAFVASLAGVSELRVRRDPSIREEYDMRVYRECIEWRHDEGVHSVADFVGRVLDSETFEEEWLDRCDEAAERFEE